MLGIAQHSQISALNERKRHSRRSCCLSDKIDHDLASPSGPRTFDRESTRVSSDRRLFRGPIFVK